MHPIAPKLFVLSVSIVLILRDIRSCVLLLLNVSSDLGHEPNTSVAYSIQHVMFNPRT